MGDPVRESAYYVTPGHGPDAEVFLVEEGRLEAASQAGRVPRVGRMLLCVRGAVGWWAAATDPAGDRVAVEVR